MMTLKLWRRFSISTFISYCQDPTTKSVDNNNSDRRDTGMTLLFFFILSGNLIKFDHGVTTPPSKVCCLLFLSLFCLFVCFFVSMLRPTSVVLISFVNPLVTMFLLLLNYFQILDFRD